jgi:hypothetical protein
VNRFKARCFCNVYSSLSTEAESTWASLGSSFDCEKRTDTLWLGLTVLRLVAGVEVVHFESPLP